jgi:hypothetical protein
VRLFGLLFFCGVVAVYLFSQPMIPVAVVCFGLFISLELFEMALTLMRAAETINKYLPHLSKIESKLYRLEEKLEVNQYRLAEISENMLQLEAINTKLQAIIDTKIDQPKIVLKP